MCAPGDPARVGEWRYAIAAPPYTNVEDISSAELRVRWSRALPGFTGTRDTIAALATQLGPGTIAPVDEGARPEVTAQQWAIVPADELVPNWKVVTVDGQHPLDKHAGALSVPLCSSTRGAIRNIDPDQLTTLVMTGTTALTRLTAKLIEDKGIDYPLRDVEPWLAAADLVHLSNEVSFVPSCKTGDGKPTREFCAKERYIRLLEKAHASIIELTGSHLHDFGHAWITHTVAMYEQRGWLWFGGGRSQIEATEPRTLEHHGNKLAFLGCNAPVTDWRALRRGPGVGGCDLPRMARQIAALRRAGFVPIVSVQHHEVYKHDPPEQLVHDLRTLAAAGAAFVMGSQAHVAHPWEVHRGAYVHYGPGNFLFDQTWHPVRDAAQDKLYIHRGALLTVGHLYTRIEEHGRPRVMDGRERGELLAALAGARRRLPRGVEPWAPPLDVAPSREHPDSVVLDGRLHSITVTTPRSIEPTRRYPLVIDLRGKEPPRDDAFVVVPAVAIARRKEAVQVIEELMTAKYPIDPNAVTRSR